MMLQAQSNKQNRKIHLTADGTKCPHLSMWRELGGGLGMTQGDCGEIDVRKDELKNDRQQKRSIWICQKELVREWCNKRRQERESCK